MSIRTTRKEHITVFVGDDIQENDPGVVFIIKGYIIYISIELVAEMSKHLSSKLSKSMLQY